MRTYVDDRYRDERERFALRCCCDDCQHWDGGRDLCELSFPTEPHRRERHQRDVAAGYILFCKHFELDE